MKKYEILHEIEMNAIELDMLTSTFLALNIALTDGTVVLKDNFLSIPCYKLEEISNNITKLTNKLFDNV